MRCCNRTTDWSDLKLLGKIDFDYTVDANKASHNFFYDCCSLYMLTSAGKNMQLTRGLTYPQHHLEGRYTEFEICIRWYAPALGQTLILLLGN